MPVSDSENELCVPAKEIKIYSNNIDIFLILIWSDPLKNKQVKYSDSQTICVSLHHIYEFTYAYGHVITRIVQLPIWTGTDVT